MALEITPTHPNADSYIALADADTYLDNRSDTSEWDALTDDQKEQLLRIATRQIDTFRFHGVKLYHKPIEYRLEQALEFPRSNIFNMSGSVNSATNSTLVCSTLANNASMPNDYWNNGAVVIINGTGKGQVKLISDFDMSTGTVTISGTWDTNPDSTSTFRLILEIPQKVKDATVEQAFYLSKGGGSRARLQAEGVTSYKIGDLSETFEGGVSGTEVKLSNEAMALLGKYISRIGRFA